MVRVDKNGIVEKSRSGRYSVTHPRRKYDTIYEVVYDDGKDRGIVWIGRTQFVFDKSWVGKKVQVHFKSFGYSVDEVNDDGNV